MILSNDIDFEKYLQLGEFSDIRSPSHWRDALAETFRNHGISSGELLPWGKTHSHVQFRQGEVSIWAGINGHSKSLITGMMALWILPVTKVCIASMEMKPPLTLQRMVRQAAGCNDVDEDFQGRFLDWAEGRLWIYDRADQVPTKTILGMVSYCAAELGISHVIIDSLMKCGIDDDDYNKQKRFVDQLCQLSKQLGVHVHLIAHMRKGESENKRPGKFDVLGSSALTNLVDNLFIVHRNKAKEEKIRLKEEVNEDEPDITMTVAKQRHGEYEGVFNLWFHPASQQIISRPGQVIPFNFGG
jgi:twinkle protein